MKNLLDKMTQLEAKAIPEKVNTAPKKKVLKESAAKKAPTTLKGMFEQLSETLAPGQKPIPVVNKQGGTQQTGAGFLNITDTSPSGKALQQALSQLGPAQAQIVVPTQPGQSGQQSGTSAAGKPNPNQMQQGQQSGTSAAGKPNPNQMQQGQQTMQEDDLDEKWAGNTKVNPAKKGMFAGKTKAELEKQLAALHKSGPHKKGSPEYTKQQELNFAIRAKSGWKKDSVEEDQLDEKYMGFEKVEKAAAKSGARDPGAVAASIGRKKYGKEKFQKAAASGKKLGEADFASTQGIDTRGAGLGAGRSPTTLEGKKAKPDFLDLDKAEKDASDEKSALQKDKFKKKTVNELSANTLNSYRDKALTDIDKKNAKGDYFGPKGSLYRSFKAATAGEKITKQGCTPITRDNRKEVKESMSNRISAARLEGKSHGLRGHAYAGKNYDDMEECRAYHDGYKEGLDECHGQGMYESALDMPIESTPAATVPGMASKALPEDDMDEGNAFTAALARTPKGSSFKLGGRTFKDRSNYDAPMHESDFAFEALDKQLNDLLNEGLSVSISKGNQNAPDSVTITAQDAEAEHLLAFVKNAGLGIFGGEEVSEPVRGFSVAPSSEVNTPGDIEVVDDHDDMLSLMKKLSGVHSGGHEGSSEDYADEDEDSGCDACGQAECECDAPPMRQIGEVESEDQMEFEVAEDNAPDNGSANSTNDTQGNAEANSSVASSDVGQDEEEGEEDERVQESYDDEEEEEDDDEDPRFPRRHPDDPRGGDDDLTEWANDAGGNVADTTFEQDIDFMTKVISGGLNKQKSTGQTTIPVIANQKGRTKYHDINESINDWAKLAGIKK